MMAHSQSNEWLPGFLRVSPLYAPLCATGVSLKHLDRWPDIEDLNQLLNDSAASAKTKSGREIRFVRQTKVMSKFAQQYEPRIYLTGEIQTRERNWHDLFNALAWLTYPRAKAALNLLHYHALLQERTLQQPMRGRLRDAATLIDESGVVVVSSNPHLIGLLRNFEWKALFWEQRTTLLEQMKFYVLGHGLLEKALRPYPGMTGKGMVMPVEDTFFEQNLTDQIAMIDVWLDNFLRRSTLSSTDLAPVPVLGYPGWTPDNEDSTYYDNQHYFRPRRIMKHPIHSC
ncbi:Protein of unknown function (DUF3025) [Nitrosomonas nitrosa]|uniref:DUF3025 domain-containing protein n=1 Tax=Nitrosomonas nitrosa TaxID=52442 RepID=A0A1I4SAC4_9PROT|nr:DUF3025 domain-containing protein [Nitrosomonas nitrosa]PTQ98376.1 Protein of unknown function (DUF3025) [Nitrosomonas nitrosa]SFM61467.1 Protein of unknown function [Nitrosomonas nitrosa]